jgi:lipopolysaccharide transport system ATP-binding protein
MSDEIAVAVHNVSKRYLLYDRPQDRLKQSLFWRFGKSYAREFWALRDVSFEVRRGETLGIIGRNGAGKSTLLQIIAGTLQPSRGKVQVNGRAVALLELGSGFNPEFTGRENVYLNGAIWGLGREEIDEHLDEITAFADIGEFIDQPVKLYSTGMYVRLAFAVHAAVPKEVLIVDEALAVGDSAFQRKCMATLEEFQAKGGSVLFVSHDTEQILRVCSRCALVDSGKLVILDKSKEVVDVYQRLLFGSEYQRKDTLAGLRVSELGVRSTNSVKGTAESRCLGPQSEDSELLPRARFDEAMPQPHMTHYGTGGAKLYDAGMFDSSGQRVNVLVMGEAYQWRYKVRFYVDAHKVRLAMMMKTVEGIGVAGISNTLEKSPIEFVPAGSTLEAVFTLRINLAPAVYFLNSGVSSSAGEEHYLHRWVDLCSIRVIARDNRETYGISYVEPSFSYRFVSSNDEIGSWGA